MHWRRFVVWQSLAPKSFGWHVKEFMDKSRPPRPRHRKFLFSAVFSWFFDILCFFLYFFWCFLSKHVETLAFVRKVFLIRIQEMVEMSFKDFMVSHGLPVVFPARCQTHRWASSLLHILWIGIQWVSHGMEVVSCISPIQMRARFIQCRLSWQCSKKWWNLQMHRTVMASPSCWERAPVETHKFSADKKKRRKGTGRALASGLGVSSRSESMRIESDRAWHGHFPWSNVDQVCRDLCCTVLEEMPKVVREHRPFVEVCHPETAVGTRCQIATLD